MKLNVIGKAEKNGDQDFWCKKRGGFAGRECGEPFPSHFDGTITDHEFYPLSKSTKLKLEQIKLVERANEIKEELKNESRSKIRISS